jgi:exonuclease VII small subunit
MEALNFLIPYLKNPFVVTTAGFFIITITLAILIFRLERKVKRLLAGGTNNLEESIKYLRTEHENARAFTEEMEKYLTSVEQRLQKSIQAVETVRFNAYDGAGANQSFATAFINEQGDGVIVSSLYSRERTSVFAKPIKGHNSDFGLSEEEKAALEATHSVTKGKKTSY